MAAARAVNMAWSMISTSVISPPIMVTMTSMTVMMVVNHAPHSGDPHRHD